MVRRGRKRAANTKQAASQVQSIVERMANVSVSNRRRRPRRRRARGNAGYTTGQNIFGGEGSMAQVVANGANRRGQFVRNVQIGNGGQITIARCELFAKVTYPKGQATDYVNGFSLQPTKDYMTFLYRLAQCYTRIRWNSMVLEWRPAVGTTQSGIITYGVRYMDDRAGAKPTSRAEVSALYPVNDHPVWQGASLVVNKDLLMSRKWYATTPNTPNTNVDALDLAPGTFEVGATVGAPDADLFLGEFWISYSVTFDGTRSEN